MAITQLNFTPSEALSREMQVMDGLNKKLETTVSRLLQPEEFFREDLAKSTFAELNQVIASLPTGAAILDIGVGKGTSSIYLASRGFRVSSIEPSRECCRILEAVAGKFQLPVKVYQGTMEAATDLPEKFDLCLFNSSLHHCDDPVLALKNCRGLLKPGGRLILLNEPILKPFRTRKWYYRKLEKDPQAMGHYGGNEHVYYAWEYERMLMAAGFKSRKSFPAYVLRDLRGTLLLMATAATEKGFVYSEKKLIQHFAWTALISRLVRLPPLRALLSRTSLLPLTFEATS